MKIRLECGSLQCHKDGQAVSLVIATQLKSGGSNLTTPKASEPVLRFVGRQRPAGAGAHIQGIARSFEQGVAKQSSLPMIWSFLQEVRRAVFCLKKSPPEILLHKSVISFGNCSNRELWHASKPPPGLPASKRRHPRGRQSRIVEPVPARRGIPPTPCHRAPAKQRPARAVRVQCLDG
jgi:hypothetical protein